MLWIVTLCGKSICEHLESEEIPFLNEKSVRIQDDDHSRHGNSSNKLFPNPEKFQRRRVSSTSSVSQTKNSISKKPLKCPYLDCGKFVGVFDMSAHYKYEHKEVPIIFTHCDARSALEFSPRDIKRGGVRTMLLLNLDDFPACGMSAPSTAVSKTSSSFPKENQTLLVLATKLSECDMDEKIREKGRRHRAEEPKDTDVWIFWLGLNVSTNLSYTLAISTLDNEIRLKYFGPVVHLEEDPVKLWANGKCLLLNRFQIERMSENFHKNLNLDIIIYSDE
ncbi:uncharacterized protein LOC123312479 isoform X2 [Coccinella septempunctata]|uniref:uncharacterized protein LOC123312479 isoform X2 n=1 Tax=Coccinella septempunctata TaxID=41139 RepID=UPI001D088F72|nr:uncharacterized protein LOC123312479 isoform X2 [Coccinella septempunctata]